MIATAPKRPFARLTVALLLVSGLVACSAGEDADGEDADGEGEEEELASTSEELRGPGPCAGKAIDRAVRCAVSKGARVLSFYRSPAEQERVRRQNGCYNRCTGMAGCVRPTADCNASPHTQCRAVDLVNDGYPVSRAQLRACGLGKTSLPHANHYDLL